MVGHQLAMLTSPEMGVSVIRLKHVLLGAGPTSSSASIMGCDEGAVMKGLQ